MEGQKFVDFITLLPDEISEKIFYRLLVDPWSKESLPMFNEDLTNCRLVCKSWNEKISSNAHLWKVAYEFLFWKLEKKSDEEEIDYKSNFLKTRKEFQEMDKLLDRIRPTEDPAVLEWLRKEFNLPFLK